MNNRVRETGSGLVVAGCALLSAGCDSDPPVDNGQFWRCSADVVVDTYEFLVFHDGSEEFSANFSICANPGTSPSDLADECADECDDYYEGVNEVFVGVECAPSTPECELNEEVKTSRSRIRRRAATT